MLLLVGERTKGADQGWTRLVQAASVATGTVACGGHRREGPPASASH